MVTQAIPSQQMVTGSEIANLGAMLAQMAAQTQLGFQDQAGYYNPALFGSMAGFQPTLARDQLNLQGELGRGNLALGQGNLQLGRDQLGLDRELGFGQLGLGRDQLNAAIAEAQRNYQLDLQRFGLEVANVNYQQRLGEATVRLEQLGLLSSLRGPSDYLAHNYVMNNMSAPEGQAADPFKIHPAPDAEHPAAPTHHHVQQPDEGPGVFRHWRWYWCGRFHLQAACERHGPEAQGSCPALTIRCRHLRQPTGGRAVEGVECLGGSAPCDTGRVRPH
jgi:hypothetical protein